MNPEELHECGVCGLVHRRASGPDDLDVTSAVGDYDAWRDANGTSRLAGSSWHESVTEVLSATNPYGQNDGRWRRPSWHIISESQNATRRDGTSHGWSFSPEEGGKEWDERDKRIAAHHEQGDHNGEYDDLIAGEDETDD